MRPRGVFKKKDTKFFKVASSENYLKAPNNQKKQQKTTKGIKSRQKLKVSRTEECRF